MGLFDTFFDGDKEVQVKCFRNMLDKYKLGNDVPCKDLGYPEDLIVYSDLENLYVIIKHGKFVKIIEQVDKLPELPIIDKFGALRSLEFIRSKVFD